MFDINLYANSGESKEVTLAGLTITGGDFGGGNFDNDGGGVSFNGTSDDATGSATLAIRDSVITGNYTGKSGEESFSEQKIAEYALAV